VNDFFAEGLCRPSSSNMMVEMQKGACFSNWKSSLN